MTLSRERSSSGISTSNSRRLSLHEQKKKRWIDMTTCVIFVYLYPVLVSVSFLFGMDAVYVLELTNKTHLHVDAKLTFFLNQSRLETMSQRYFMKRECVGVLYLSSISPGVSRNHISQRQVADLGF